MRSSLLLGLLVYVFCSQVLLAQVPTNGMIAYYPFNGDTKDYSGHLHNGTTFGTMVLGNDRFGRANRAYVFDGVDDFIKIPTATDLNFYGNDFTISTWVFETTRNSGLQSALISKRNIENSKRIGYALSITGDEHPWGSGQGLYQLGGGANSSAITPDLTPLGTWYQMVFTYNKTAQVGKFYIDGLLVFTSAKLAPPIANTASVYIGGDSLALSSAKGYLFKGLLDDIRFYNRQLTDADVTQLYEAETCVYKNITEQSMSICSGDSVLIGHTYHSTPGIYYDSLIAIYGCDSIIKTTLHVNQSYSISIFDTIPQGDTLLFGSQVLTHAGDYTSVFTSVEGCDSTVHLKLSIDSITPYFSVAGRIFTKDYSTLSGTVELYNVGANASASPKQIVTISNNTFKFDLIPIDYYILLARPDSISGYQPTYFYTKTSQSKAHVIYVDGHIGKVDIYMIPEGVGIDKLTNASVEVYPNPTTGKLYITHLTKMDRVEVYNAMGECILKTKDEEIDLMDQQSGVYFIKIYSENNMRIEKIIKQ